MTFVGTILEICTIPSEAKYYIISQKDNQYQPEFFSKKSEEEYQMIPKGFGHMALIKRMDDGQIFPYFHNQESQ
tara:strand:- start:423 stop:644 length:222 start_codon:yes stop_codon:yes gene_type:complete